jgi:hypothetical protein
LLFKSTAEYAITKVQKNQAGLNLNETHQLLIYSDHINLLWNNINTTKENTEALTGRRLV